MNFPTDMTPHRAARVRSLLVETVTEAPARRRRKIRRRVAIWAPVAALSIGVVSIAAATIVGSSPVESYEVVHCLESVERGPNGGYIEAQAVLERDRIDGATIDDAVRICTEMWEQGALPLGGDPLDPSPGRYEAPDKLTPCVMPDGSPAIVPGGAKACSALGLAKYR